MNEKAKEQFVKRKKEKKSAQVMGNDKHNDKINQENFQDSVFVNTSFFNYTPLPHLFSGK